MSKSRLILLLLSAIPAALLAAVPGRADTGSPSSLPPRVISSASELDYPPFSVVRSDGSADGFSVELLEAVAEAAGMKVTFKVGPWDEIKNELIDGRLDALPLVSYSKERDGVLDFTAPYLRMHGAIFVRKGEKSIHDEKALKNKEVLVMRGDSAHEYALRNNLTDKLILTDTFEEAFKQLASGKHDAVIAQYLMGLQLIKKLNLTNVVSVRSIQESTLKPVAEPLIGFEQKFCIAVKEGDKELLARLNEGLAIVIANGVYDDLYDKWFSPILPSPSVTLATILRYLFIILFPLLALIGIIGFWYFKREVARKTINLREEIKIREAAEQSLMQTRDTLQAILNSAPAGVVVADRTGRVLHSSDFTQHILGGSIDGQMYGTDSGFCLSGLDGSPLPEGRLPLSLALAGRTVFDTELLVTRSDGTQSVILVSATPLKNRENDVWAAATVFQDITDRKKAEAALQSSNERLELLATVAERLLRDEDPQAIVEEICRLVMARIDCQFFFNYLIDVPGQRMQLNACAGIPDETAAAIRHLDFGVAVCGCVARDQERIIAEDIQHGEDQRTQLVKSFGVQAYCCHPLVAQGVLIGTLSFGTRTRPTFHADEVALMKSVADQVAVAMQRLRINQALRENDERLRRSLNEKEVLLKEIHHRVKNNMQVVSSLLELQSYEIQDPAIREIFRDLRGRVRSMAMVHEKLYQSTDLARVEFGDYAKSLLGYLLQAQGAAAFGVRLELDLDQVYLPVDAAVPLGLILNELFTNALKHAFKGTEGGRVWVSLGGNGQSMVRLGVRDNGVGLPPEIDWKKPSSLGLRLVQMLARQLHAGLEVTVDKGTEFTVTLKEPTK